MRPPIAKSQLKPGMMFISDSGGPVVFMSSGGPSSVSRDRELSDPFAEQKRLLALGEAKLKEIKAVLAARKR